MSANKENNLVQAYIELNKFCQNGDYDRALKAAGKVLQIAPNEQKAFHCKVVCFLQLHNFKEALAVLTNSKNAALSADLHFEKAYAQYRLNNPKDALQTVDSVPELTPALKELRAQILYRLEQYQDCYNFYRDIVKNTNDDYEDERKANMSAVVANLAELNPAGDYPQFDETTYELSYNAGSTLAMRGKYSEALPVLKRAEQKCSESVIDDGGTEEEAKEEGAIIRAQQAYCLQQMGKEKEAAAIYHTILKDKPSDQALSAIASNNLVVINREGNVFDSRKRMKTATQDGLEHKLNSRQRANIAYNQAILSIYTNQPDFCKQCCVKLSREFNQPSRAAVVEAASLVKQGQASPAAALLAAWPGLALAAVQLYLAQGDTATALATLARSPLRHRAGVLALRRALLTAGGAGAGGAGAGGAGAAARDAVSDMFLEACNQLTDAPCTPSTRAVWEAAGAAHAAAGRAELAAAACDAQGGAEGRAAGGAGARRARARLVRALARVQPARAAALKEKLPAPAKQGEIDIEALESSKWMMGAKVVKKNVSKQEQSPGTPAVESQQRKQRRKRKCKLPPNADLSKPPDPERWLPRHERAAFRRRRARRDVIKGSQGLQSNAADVYDMSKQAPTAASPAAGKSPRVDKAGDSAWQRKQQQKKKGKKKW